MVSECRDVYYLEGEVAKLINITYPARSTLIVLRVSMIFAPEGNKRRKSQVTDTHSMGCWACWWPTALAQKAIGRKLMRDQHV